MSVGTKFFIVILIGCCVALILIYAHSGKRNKPGEGAPESPDAISGAGKYIP